MTSHTRNKLLYFFTAALLALSQAAASDPSTAPVSASPAISVVRDRSGCPDCAFFAVPVETTQAARIFKKSAPFLVSTLDRIPPPLWGAAVDRKTNRAYCLDAEDLTDWNALFREENPSLATDEALDDLIRVFLDLAVGGATYVPKLTSAEEAVVRRHATARPPTSTRVIRTKDRLGLYFYAKDLRGRLTLWNLIVEPTGQILKTDRREF